MLNKSTFLKLDKLTSSCKEAKDAFSDIDIEVQQYAATINKIKEKLDEHDYFYKFSYNEETL